MADYCQKSKTTTFCSLPLLSQRCVFSASIMVFAQLNFTSNSLLLHGVHFSHLSGRDSCNCLWFLINHLYIQTRPLLVQRYRSIPSADFWRQRQIAASHGFWVPGRLAHGQHISHVFTSKVNELLPFSARLCCLSHFSQVSAGWESSVEPSVTAESLRVAYLIHSLWFQFGPSA